MKKFLFGITSFIFLSAISPLVSAAEIDTPSCIDVEQSAVNLYGRCQVFPTPCVVPDNWKKVSSCENIKARKIGKSLEERRKIRSLEYLKRKRNQKQKDLSDSSLEKNPKRSRLRGTIKPRQKKIKRAIKKGIRKTSTRKASYLRKKYSQKGILSEKKEPKKIRKKRRIRSSVSRHLRRGKLSNEVKASTLIKLRSQRNTGAKKDWYNTYISEKRKLQKSKRKPYVYKGRRLQRTFKGERLYGDLENQSNRSILKDETPKDEE